MSTGRRLRSRVTPGGHPGNPGLDPVTGIHIEGYRFIQPSCSQCHGSILDMAADPRSTLYKAKLVADFIAVHATARQKSHETPRPLLVSMQGPQGAGKQTPFSPVLTCRQEHARG